MPFTVGVYTLGCKVNQYETESMRQQFVNAGFESVDENDFADVYIINTCTVTNLSDRKSRQHIRRMKKRGCKSPEIPGLRLPTATIPICWPSIRCIFSMQKSRRIASSSAALWRTGIPCRRSWRAILRRVRPPCLP